MAEPNPTTPDGNTSPPPPPTTPDLPTVDDLIGKHDDLPTADELLNKAVPADEQREIEQRRYRLINTGTERTSPVQDFLFRADSPVQTVWRNVGRVMSAFGHGYSEGYGERPTGLTPEQEQDLRKYGIWNEYLNGQNSLSKAANETLIRNGAWALDAAWRGAFQAPFAAAQEGVRSLGEQEGFEGYRVGGANWGVRQDWLGNPSSGQSRQATLAELAASPEAFMGSPHPTGVPHPVGPPPIRGVGDLTAAVDAGRLTREDAALYARSKGWDVSPSEISAARPGLGMSGGITPDDINAARNLNVIGPDGEAGFQGTKQGDHPKPLPVEGPPAPPPPPDLHAVVRNAQPQLFEEYDTLLKRRDILRRFIEDPDAAKMGDLSKVEGNLKEAESRLRELAPQVETAYRKAETDTGVSRSPSSVQGVPPAPEQPPPNAPARDTTGLTAMSGEMGRGIAESLHQHLWDRIQAGKLNETDNMPPSAVLQGAQMLRARGGLRTFDEYRAYADDFAKNVRTGTADFQGDMRSLLARHLPAETPPREGETPPPPPPRPESLPPDLANATPRYNAGMRQYEPQFESDVDKALYIVSGAGKSARHDDYVTWLKGLGLTDEQIRSGGAQVRAKIKEQTTGAAEGPVQIPRVVSRETEQGGQAPETARAAQAEQAPPLVGPEHPIVVEETRRMMAAGIPEAEARAAAVVQAHMWETHAERMEGRRGTAVEAYRRYGPSVKGGRGMAPARAIAAVKAAPAPRAPVPETTAAAESALAKLDAVAGVKSGANAVPATPEIKTATDFVGAVADLKAKFGKKKERKIPLGEDVADAEEVPPQPDELLQSDQAKNDILGEEFNAEPYVREVMAAPEAQAEGSAMRGIAMDVRSFSNDAKEMLGIARQHDGFDVPEDAAEREKLVDAFVDARDLLDEHAQAGYELIERIDKAGDDIADRADTLATEFQNLRDEANELQEQITDKYNEIVEDVLADLLERRDAEEEAEADAREARGEARYPPSTLPATKEREPLPAHYTVIDVMAHEKRDIEAKIARVKANPAVKELLEADIEKLDEETADRLINAVDDDIAAINGARHRADVWLHRAINFQNNASDLMESVKDDIVRPILDAIEEASQALHDRVLDGSDGPEANTAYRIREIRHMQEINERQKNSLPIEHYEASKRELELELQLANGSITKEEFGRQMEALYGEPPEGGWKSHFAADELHQAGQRPVSEGFPLFQDKNKNVIRGKTRISPDTAIPPEITYFKDANASTLLHEPAHAWFFRFARDAMEGDAPEQVKADFRTTLDWLGAETPEQMFERTSQGKLTARARGLHEKFARGFEAYFMEGWAPSEAVARVFEQFRQWLVKIYGSLKGLEDEAGFKINLTPEMRAVFDRRLTTQPRERPVIAPESERTPGIGDIHEADAAVADEHETAATADNIQTERDKEASQHVPEFEGPRRGDVPLETRGGAPGGSEPGGADNAAGRAAGEGGNPASIGEERAGGGTPSGKGAGVRGEAGSEPNLTGLAGASPRTTRPTSSAEPFAPPERFIDKAGNIRLDLITDKEDVRQVLRDMANENNQFITERRGKISDDAALKLADALGMDVAKLNLRRIGQAFNSEEIIAAAKLLVQAATDVRDKMLKAAEGGDEDVLALAEARERLLMIQGQFSGITAEAGRALRAFQVVRQMKGMKEALDLAEFVRDAAGGVDLFQLRRMARLGSVLPTAGQVSQFVRTSAHLTRFEKGSDMLLEWWINCLISGPATHTTYAAGNLLLALNRMGPETAVAAAIGSLRRAFGDNGPRVYWGEVPAQLFGMIHGAPTAVRATWEAGKTGLTTALPGELAGMSATQLGRSPMTVMRAAIPDFTVGGVPVPVGTFARLPSRVVAMIHSFFRALNYSREMAAIAYRDAAQQGLSGQAFAAHVASTLTNPAADMMEQARTSATDLTLMGHGGALTRNLSRLTNTRFMGGQWLKFVDPFVHISSNVIEQAILQRTPVGVIDPEIRANLTGVNGPVARDMAIARMVVGSGMAVGFGSMAAMGLMNGSGPSDPRERALWTMVNGPPHSVRVGNMWYQINRLGPLGMLAGISADMYELAQKLGDEDASKIASDVTHAFTQNILDESFMRGPAELMRALSDPDRYGASWVRQFVSSFVPYSVGQAQVARAIDPWSRQTRTTLDAMKAKIPWLSETLLPRRDVFGEPIPNKSALGVPGLSAIYEQMVNNDPVPRAMLGAGYFPAMPLRKIRNVELTDRQYDDYCRIAGRMAKIRLDAIVRMPGFDMLPPGTRHELMRNAVTQSRQEAESVVMMQNPDIIRQARDAKVAKIQGQKVH